MGVGVRIARAARAVRNYGGAVVPRKREAGDRAPSVEYINGTWRRSRRERDARVECSAHIVECGAKN
jgi:hypothetical protein